jgi:isopentenyl-diphosphate Delta-isomerase
MTSTTVTTREPASEPPTEEVELSPAQGYDDEQIRLMEELCIVVDENDKPIRSGTKKECSRLFYSG